MNAPAERVSLEAFTALWRRLGARPDPGPTHTVLCNTHGEPHRHYHTLAHVAHVLTMFDGVRHCLRDSDAAEMALWLHDLVYDTHAGDSEAQSAIQARILLRHAGVKPGVITHVADLILVTDHAATPDPDDPDAGYVMDADLAILGTSDADFLRYERQIREEYRWVPDPTYRLRRAGILRRFLERPYIYHTPQFRHLESRARLNLAFALTRLQTLP